MLLETIGMVLILAATTMTGAYLCLRERYHVQDLQTLQQAVLGIQNQILYLSAPLPEVLEAVSYQINGEIGSVLQETAQHMQQRTEQTAEEIWESVWRKHLPCTFLTGRDYEALMQYGKTLGYLNKEQQKDNSRFLLEYLQREQETLRRRLEKNGRLYYSMGFLGGLLVVVILL